MTELTQETEDLFFHTIRSTLETRSLDERDGRSFIEKYARAKSLRMTKTDSRRLTRHMLDRKDIRHEE